MPKRLTLAPHCGVEELHRHYRQAKDPIVRSRFHILWLLAQSQPSEAVAKATGYTRPWIRRLVRRYNAQGPVGLEDRRHHNPGSRLSLSPEQVQALEAALEQPPDDGGLWTGPKVAAWLTQRLGRPVKRHLGWRWLRRLGYSLHVPRPEHVQADPSAQALFKNAWLGPSRRATGRVSARPHRSVGDG